MMNNLRARIKAPSLGSGLLPKEGHQEAGGGVDGNKDGVTPKGSTEPVQVEPKTFFANERTFIQWISAALLLLTVSSIMMSGANRYNGTSSLIAFCALVLVCYSAYTYFRRVNLLVSGSGYGYLDVLGPSVLAAGVGLGVFFVFADAIKGNDILAGKKGKYKDDDRRRVLLGHEDIPSLFLSEVPGQCTRHSMAGINLLEFLPRDVALAHDKNSGLMIATPQSLVSLAFDEGNKILAQVPDVEIQSVVSVGPSVFALSTGPYNTELIEFEVSTLLSRSSSQNVGTDVIKARYIIQDKSSTVGSMTFVPSSTADDSGSFYIHLDGDIHSYRLATRPDKDIPMLSLVGTINMKMIHASDDEVVHNPAMITSMTHFEGVTYLLRSDLGVIDAWDLTHGTFIAEVPLPKVNDDPLKGYPWVGIAFQRQLKSLRDASHLRSKNLSTNDSQTASLALHMSLDTFPPQIWTFQLEEYENNAFGFPTCAGNAQIN